MSRCWWAGLAVCVGMAGCGGANKAASPPQMPPEQPGYGQPYYGQPGADGEESVESEGGAERPSDGYVQSPGPVAPGRGLRYAEPPTSVTDAPRGADEFSHLLEDFSVAESLALSGQAGCEHACRALRSMLRSADRLCALAQDDQEQRACADARRRVRAARRFVRSSCGVCARGPNLDED